jgi:predicted nucleic acid-binding protein
MDRQKQDPPSILIDSNIFLEVLLNREKETECRPLLRMVQNGTVSAYVTSFSLHGIEVHLDGARKPKKLESFLVWVEEAQGLTVYHTSPQEEAQAVAISRKLPLDFDDALQLFVAESLGLHLVTYDHDFGDAGIRTQSPVDYLATNF